MKIHKLKGILQDMSIAELMRICNQLEIKINHSYSSSLTIKKHKLKRKLNTLSTYKLTKLCKIFNIHLRPDDMYVKKNMLNLLINNKKCLETNGALVGGADRASEIGTSVVAGLGVGTLVVSAVVASVVVISAIAAFTIVKKVTRGAVAFGKTVYTDRKESLRLKKQYEHEEKMAQLKSGDTHQSTTSEGDDSDAHHRDRKEEDFIDQEDPKTIDKCNQRVKEINKVGDDIDKLKNLKKHHLKETTTALDQITPLDNDEKQAIFIVHSYRQIKSTYSQLRSNLDIISRQFIPGLHSVTKGLIKQKILEILKPLKGEGEDKDLSKFVKLLDETQNRTTRYFIKKYLVSEQKWELAYRLVNDQHAGGKISPVDINSWRYAYQTIHSHKVKSIQKKNVSIIQPDYTKHRLTYHTGGADAEMIQQQESAKRIQRLFRGKGAKDLKGAKVLKDRFKKEVDNIIDELIKAFKSYLEKAIPR